MLNLAYRIAAVILVIFASQIIAPMGLALDYPPAATGWGFDFAGANFAEKPGNDFFRYANGSWYDRAVIPADRSSIGPSVLLRMIPRRPASGRYSNRRGRGAARPHKQMHPRSALSQLGDRSSRPCTR